MQDSELDDLIERLKRERAPLKSAKLAKVPKRTQLAPDAPAPQTNAMIADRGVELTTQAVEAWTARVGGVPICDVAHQMGISIEAAKILIKEAHAAIHEDLKANLNLNRELDLQRVDGLIRSYYGPACQGDERAAGVVLKCLSQRSQLTGTVAAPDPGRSHPENVVVWIQQQLPAINKIVDALPLD